MAPSRPSGASKKKAANKEGGQQRGRDRGGGQSHLPRNPIDLAANQHCQTLLSHKSSAKTVDSWLPGGSIRPFLDEKPAPLQRQKMVRETDLIRGPRLPQPNQTVIGHGPEHRTSGSPHFNRPGTRLRGLAACFARALLSASRPLRTKGAGKAGCRLAPAVCCAKV